MILDYEMDYKLWTITDHKWTISEWCLWFFLDVISTLLDLGGDAFAFDDRGRLPLFSHCNTNGGLSALYDLFEHMMKKENSRKIRDLLSEEDIDHDSR